MLRMFKRIAWIGLLAVGGLTAHGFSLIGPYASWQVHDLGYALNGDLGGPMNIGEEFRRNTPVMYYAADANFYTFFGSNGVWSVDQAFAILNNLSPVSSYSADLSEFPLEVRRPNYRAAALNLMDIKSTVLGLMMEQMGLADPIRYTWTLHDRYTSTSPNQYLVVKRNFEIVPTLLDQLQYSSFVNEQYYTYRIHDYSPATPPNGAPLSEAREFGVDVPEYMMGFTPVAALRSLASGSFYTGLTRDDVAGLRYLLRSGNVNWEDNPPNSLVYVTNNAPSALQMIVTSNLTLLSAQSLTNDDAGLLAIYPGIVIVPGSTVASLSNVVSTNLTAYYTNYPMDPVGTPPHMLYVTNYDTNVIFVYRRQFANVVTNSYATKSWVTVIETNIYFPPLAPVGYFTTNSTRVTMQTNQFTGDFYILTNACGLQILSNVLTKVTGITNTLVVTNMVTSNMLSGTFLLSRTYITWFTNHYLADFPVLCVTNEPGLRRGVEKITFVKTAYDSLLGKFYQPQTNSFTMTTVTNSTNWVQTFQRVVTTPDFLFTAQDMLPGPSADLIWNESARNIVFNATNQLNGMNGPGTIDPITVITFNRSGPVYYNYAPANMNERTSIRFSIWASFDDSTNAPVIYPNGTSIASVESQMLMQVTSTTLPPARAHISYTTQLTGSGGSGSPYTWSLAPDSAALPSGLSLSSGGVLSGSPATSGIYSFFVKMSDRGGGFTVWQVTLTVLP